MYSRELQKLIVRWTLKEVFTMYDLIYSVLSLINLDNSLMVNTTIKNLENLLTGIIPDVYFVKQKNDHIIWIIKTYSKGEICKVIISKKTFEIV